MLSLAHWRFRKILEADGGPLSRISSRRTSSQFPDRRYEAFATLRETLRPRARPGIYGSADGTGSGRTEAAAIHRAISEAMERWAFHTTQPGPDATRFGFDVNPTTTGMAAFPGLSARAPRAIALREAIERWSICAWWEGRLPACREAGVESGIEVIRIHTPWTDSPVALLASPSSSGPPLCYGFACGRNWREAVSRARIEWERNQETLLKQASQGTLAATLEEERLIFFSKPEGRKHFDERLSQSEQKQDLPATPRLIIDQEIRGPWSGYAAVWRCLFEWNSGDKYLKAPEFFLF